MKVDLKQVNAFGYRQRTLHILWGLIQWAHWYFDCDWNDDIYWRSNIIYMPNLLRMIGSLLVSFFRFHFIFVFSRFRLKRKMYRDFTRTLSITIQPFRDRKYDKPNWMRENQISHANIFVFFFFLNTHNRIFWPLHIRKQKRNTR